MTEPDRVSFVIRAGGGNATQLSIQEAAARLGIDHKTVADIAGPRPLSGDVSISVWGRRVWVGDTGFLLDKWQQPPAVGFDSGIDAQLRAQVAVYATAINNENAVHNSLQELNSLARAALEPSELAAYTQTAADVLLETADETDDLEIEAVRMRIALIDTLWRARLGRPEATNPVRSAGQPA